MYTKLMQLSKHQVGETLNAIVATVSRGKKRKWRRDDWDWEEKLQGKKGKRRTKGKGKRHVVRLGDKGEGRSQREGKKTRGREGDKEKGYETREGKGREEAERREITEGEKLNFSFPPIMHEILLKKVQKRICC